MIEITHLTKKYGEKIALNDVSFAIAKGEIVGLIGKNISLPFLAYTTVKKAQNH